MSTVAQPPVRHGKCHLELWINGICYSARKQRGPDRHSKLWRLTRDSYSFGGPRVSYTVAKARGEVVCTCPDAFMRGAWCKHARALIAAGILNGRSPARAPKGGVK